MVTTARGPDFVRAAAMVCAALAAACSAAAQSRSPAMVFENVQVVPMAGAGVLPDHVVLLRGDVIAALGPRGTIEIPRDAFRIDGNGGYLMPGLVDTHVHLYDVPDFISYLAHGVTAVLNLNGSPRVLEWRARIAAGEILGPSVYTSGPSVDGDPPVNPTFVAAGTLDAAARIVAAQRREGYDFVKVYHLIDRDVYLALVAAGKREGIPIVGHVPRSVGVDLALRSGQVMVAHAEEFFREAADESRMRGMAFVAQSAGVAVVPNLFAFRDFIDAALDLAGVLKDPELRYASPAVYIDKLPSNRRGATTTPRERVASLREDMARFARFSVLLDQAGGLVLAGTDTEIFGLAGTSLHQELEALVAGGVPVARALAAATRNAGAFIRRHVSHSPGFGQIEVGYRADLVLLAGNPLEDLATLRNPRGVMLRGKWLPSDVLRRMRDSVARTHENARRMLFEFDSLVAARRGSDAVHALARFRSAHPELLAAPEIALRHYGRRLREVDAGAWVEVARATVQLYPASPSAHEELATALHAAGDRQGIAHLRRAVAMSPHDAWLSNRLARSEATLGPQRFEAAGVYDLRIADQQSTAYPPPTPRGALLRLVRRGDALGGMLEREGLPGVAVGDVIAGHDRLWIDALPAGERPIELRLTVQGDTVAGFWVQGVGRRWALTGRRND